MEDVAEKSRRNLMLLATGIIVVWLLGIPLQGHLVGAVNLDTVEPYRAWLCALGALAYFFLRYHLEPKNSAERKKWKAYRRGLLRRRFELLVASEFAHFRNGGITKLQFSPQRELEPGDRMGGIPVPSEPTFTKQFRAGSVPYEVIRTFVFGRPDSDDPEMVDSTIGNSACNFKVPLPLELRIRLLNTYAGYRRLSWNSLEFTLPYAWSCIAAVVCFAKIASSLYYDFPFVRQLLST